MGLFDFIKNRGRKVEEDDDKPKAGTSAAPKSTLDPDNRDRWMGARLVRIVENTGIAVEDLSVKVDGDRATVKGKVDSQEEKEKVVLTVGNINGIAKVDDQLTVEKEGTQADFYTVKEGDTLSKIAKAHYGDPNKYHQIFEANRPMLDDPDKIYPGQTLRIPAA